MTMLTRATDTLAGTVIGKWHYSFSGVEALAPKRSVFPTRRETGQKKSDQTFNKLTQQIRDFAKLETNWDGYGVAAPNQKAIKQALAVIELADDADMLPKRVDASVEEGIALSFIRGTRYADIECFNNGEILGVTHDRAIQERTKRPLVWTIKDDQGIIEALDRIKDFINA